MNGSSLVGGGTFYVPRILSVRPGPPLAFNIRTVPGQTPGDYRAKAAAIAYNLNVRAVDITALEPDLIRLTLLGPSPRAPFGSGDHEPWNDTHDPRPRGTEELLRLSARRSCPRGVGEGGGLRSEGLLD
jgi:hypothetical protein